MIDWNSQTADYAIVALENSRTGGTEVADGRPAFRADQFIGMRSEAEIGKFLDATAAYLPLANSFRMQVNAKSLHPDVPGSDMVAAALRAVAARGYGIILVYTDPVFHGDRPKDDAYWAANVSVLDGRPIELDGEVVSRRNRRALYSWGAASPEYDPVDYLRDGWGAVLDWLDANPEVKAQVRGYELVNEPGRVYTDANNPTEMRAYAEAMVEVWGAHKDRWTSGASSAPARILVDIAGGGSGRVGALDRVAPGRAESALDLIRGRIGAPLVWSVHTFTDTSLEEFRSPDSHTGLVKLAGDDILITETQFDGDFQLMGAESGPLRDLAARYGVAGRPGVALEPADFYADGQARLAPWMGWELLDPILGSRNYFGAREKPWYGAAGIGSGFWTPVGFDASMFVGYSGKNVEVARDISAFANLMWSAGDPPRVAPLPEGTGCGAVDVCIADAEAMVARRPHLAPRIGAGSDGPDVIAGVDSPATEGGRRYFRQGGKEQFAGQTREDADFASNGDMAYGRGGDDRITLAGGDDFGFGGPGADQIDGGTGHDVLLGGDGDDSIGGGEGDDVVEGGAGNDTLSGGPGVNLIKGDAGDDVMIAGPGVDWFYLDAAGDGQDTIRGFAWGTDRLVVADPFTGDDKRRVETVNTSAPLTEHSYAPGGTVVFVP
ncbi:calcium-binding protein [Paracoccus panacisoli]|uniref:Calcium-binding protein n=1 Tax=Paracoccus panacisoli TaxID=1510163 RepID=A0ABV6T2Y2_9RHOB